MGSLAFAMEAALKAETSKSSAAVLHIACSPFSPLEQHRHRPSMKDLDGAERGPEILMACVEHVCL